MNIKINSTENDRLLKHEMGPRITVGSRMYGTHKEDSDYDIVCFYDEKALGVARSVLLEGIDLTHCFQYDDLDHQYIWATNEQFGRNIWSGDSTLFCEAYMWGITGHCEEQLIKEMRTYNILKSFTGFCRRDIKYLGTSKDKGNRRFHIERGIYIAETLFNGNLPKLERLKDLPKDRPKKDMETHLKTLKKQLTDAYQNDTLTKYPVREYPYRSGSLCEKMIIACNTREFQYN